jgi:S-adenosylmethionine/arginine decarboxylase-like enzyme
MPLHHEHLIARAEVSAPPKNLQEVNTWLTDLIQEMGMNILHGPFSMSCDLENNEGITAGCILSTSHCVLHTWDACSPAILQLDIYTCSKLNLDMVWDKLETFKPLKIDYKFLDRETGLVEIL